MREQKNWVKKSAKNSYHNKTTLKENIASKCSLRSKKEIFRAEKYSFSLVITFFAV